MARIFVAILLFFVQNAFAALELELTQGVDNALPIVIANFAGDDGQIAQVISNDLKNSGRFKPVDAENQDVGAIDFDGLRARKVEAITTGKITSIGGGKYQVFFSLFDVFHKSKVVEKDYTVNKAQFRNLSHHISDIIYQQLTGDRGVFSTKIAYILVERQGRSAKYKFQVADSDGYNPRVFLVSNFPLMSPTWSPDGKKIAYVSFEGNRAAIYLQDIATGERKILSKFPGINGAPAWSHDGTKLALVLTLTGYPKIYVLDLATNRMQRLTDDWYLDTEPSWAPDGRSIIFTSNRSGSSPQIYRVYLDSKKIERVTFSGPYNARASFMPNGNSIVMLHQEGDMFSIASQDLVSSRVTVLTKSGFNESPSLAPNGKMIVYATTENGRGMLAEVSFDGKVKLLLPAGEGAVQEPAWSPFLN